ncbi:MAG: hypothetical protein WD273_00320 [Trueperaceae bacterium]
MRIGFVTQLLWDRYGAFWHHLFEEIGAEVAVPDSESVPGFLDDSRVTSVPGLAFQLAVAQALTLQECDLLVVPSLNAGSESRRGGGQDPWVSDFPGALGTLRGIPPVLGVPAWLAAGQETLVVESLQQIVRDATRVRRVWDRHRSRLRHEPLSDPGWGTAAGRKTVGVLGQPWLLNDDLASRVAPAEARVIGQHKIDPFRLREEGSRLDPRMIPTDQEALGAARLFSRRGTVSELHLIIDVTSGSDLWLQDRITKHAGKPLVVHSLQEIITDGSFELLAKGNGM